MRNLHDFRNSFSHSPNNKERINISFIYPCAGLRFVRNKTLHLGQLPPHITDTYAISP